MAGSDNAKSICSMIGAGGVIVHIVSRHVPTQIVSSWVLLSNASCSPSQSVCFLKLFIPGAFDPCVVLCVEHSSSVRLSAACDLTSYVHRVYCTCEQINSTHCLFLRECAILFKILSTPRIFLPIFYRVQSQCKLSDTLHVLHQLIHWSCERRVSARFGGCYATYYPSVVGSTVPGRGKRNVTLSPIRGLYRDCSLSDGSFSSEPCSLVCLLACFFTLMNHGSTGSTAASSHDNSRVAFQPRLRVRC